MTLVTDNYSSSSCSTTSSTDNTLVISTSISKSSETPEPVAMMRLSPAAEMAIRLLPGNDRCVECKVICPQWASVSFGVLLCLTCAGKHRSLGVQTSFVKSLVMDDWSLSEVRALKLGGNAKWVAVCAGSGVEDLAMLEKYSSCVAKAYKLRVSRAAVSDSSAECAFTATSFLMKLAGIASVIEENSALTKGRGLSATIATKAIVADKAGFYLSDDADNTRVKCTTCCLIVSVDKLSLHSASCTVSAPQAVGWKTYERKIGDSDEPLGFTVAKASSGYAEVYRIIPGGAAERANVIVGSLLIGLNNEKNLKFDEIVAILRTLPRPILFHFVFRSQVAPEGPQTVISSVPEPRAVIVNVTLHDKQELGCSLSASGLYCVVRSVDEECIARRHGVLVGSRVVAVNGQKYLKPKDFIHEICTAQRPIKITVHRVEGLMRGWSS